MANSRITCWVAAQVLVWFLLSLSLCVFGANIKCGQCQESRCPELHYCEGEVVKDYCGCCTVCSNSKYQPHPLRMAGYKERDEGSACAQVDCPKFKICLVNVQGLPLCTCPSDYICRSRSKKKPVCGSDGVTYQSRCYLRIAACNSATRIKVAIKGPCKGSAGADLPARTRSCHSFSKCKRRQNEQPVCGTDAKTYLSRCHLKYTACQKEVKIKVQRLGTCELPQNPGPHVVVQTPVSSPHSYNDAAMLETAAANLRRKAERRRKRRKERGQVEGDAESEDERRHWRREKRKKRKERRRKRRKTRGKRRSRRYKIDRNRFRRTFEHVKRWKY